jgi:hypothetical protein
MLCTHLHLLSLVPEEQTDQSWKPSNSNGLSEIKCTVTTEQYLGTKTIINIQEVAEKDPLNILSQIVMRNLNAEVTVSLPISTDQC